MSVLLPKDLCRTSDSQKTLEPSHAEEIPRKHFRELLRVLPADERPDKKNLFKLIEEKEEENERAEAPYSMPLPILSPSDLSSSIAVQNALSPQIEAIFEKMASMMIVMSSSGDVETTLFLDNPHFASSLFFGTQITIREFTTAPKAFNIEITSFSPAISAIESCKNALLSSFRNGNFNFSVHRFDTHIQNEERPVLHRKESGDRDNEGRKGGRE